MAETDMVERVARACREAVALDRGRSVSFEEMSFIVARAAIEVLSPAMVGGIVRPMIDKLTFLLAFAICFGIGSALVWLVI